jgi:pimeloyl-ACP methyl ester carboxylesterase
MEHTIDLAQGTIEYRDTGEGEPIVFVHGLLVDGGLWRKVTPRLEPAYRCIAPDWPLGSHRTPLAAGADRSPRGIAHLIADFLDALELEGVTIVANDTGGAISQILASERPERLRALVLTNCDCLENFLPPVLRPLQWLAHVPGGYRPIAAAMGSARVRRSPAGFGMLVHEPIPDEVTAAWAAPLRRPEIRADMVATLKAIDKRDTLRAAEVLREQPVPTLLAWAPDDMMFPIRFAERLQAMIPGARLERIEHSRAFVPEDQPERLADLVTEYLVGDRLAQSSSRAESSSRAGGPGSAGVSSGAGSRS